MYSAYNVLNNIKIGRPVDAGQRHMHDVTACVTYLRFGSFEKPPAKPAKEPAGDTSVEPVIPPTDLPLLFAQHINQAGAPEHTDALASRLPRLAHANLLPTFERERIAFLLSHAVREFLPQVLATVEIYASGHLARKLPSINPAPELFAGGVLRMSEFVASRFPLMPAISIASSPSENAAYSVLEAILMATHDIDTENYEAAAKILALTFSAAPQFVDMLSILDKLLKIGSPPYPAALDVLTQERLQSLSKLTSK